MNQDTQEEKMKILKISQPTPEPKTIIDIKKPTDYNGDLLYYNVKIYNDIGTTPPIPCEMSETRVAPLIEDCSQYMIGVQRFTIPTMIPLQIYPDPSIVTTQYRVALSYKTNVVSKPIDFVNFYEDALYAPKREILSFQQILDMINIAYQKCYNDLIVLDPSFAGIAGGPPIFQYDAISRLILFYAPDIYSNYLNATTPCSMSMSSTFYLQYIVGFPTRSPDPVLPVGVLGAVFIVENRIDNIKVVGPTTFYKMYAEYDMRALFNHLSSLIFETSSIPSNPEFIQSENNVSRRILVDFEVQAGYSNGDPIQFSTSGLSNVRWHAMNASVPLSTFDVKLYVQYKTGQIYPLYLLEGDLATIKFVFAKKSFLKGTNLSQPIT